MSKIKAVLVTLMLGSSSAAMADSAVSFTAQGSLAFGTHASAPVTRDHRAYPMPVNQYSWLSLGSQMSLSTGKTTIRPSLAMISQLRLQASTGSSYVKKVQVKFRDGSVQNVRLDQWITSRDPMINLSLTANRSGVDSIVITGSASYNARYQLFAQGAGVVELPPPVITQPPVYHLPEYQGLSLGTGMSFAGTDGRRIIELTGEKEGFSMLRLQGETGSTSVRQILIRFENGHEQLLSGVNQTLGRGQVYNVRLDGNGSYAVHSVVVYNASGATQISTGTFNATLL